MTGIFITFEGGEGAGKSTQSQRLAEHIIALGRTLVHTREPGGTPAGEAIRDVVLNRKYDGLDERAEALLFAAARGEHVARIIRPALDRGDVVLCDRYLDSSVAYQGYGRDLGPDTVRDLSLWSTRHLLPDLAIILDIDPRIGLARVPDPDRIEVESIEYHDKVRAGFLAIAGQEPQRTIVVDASLPMDEVTALIIARVDRMLAPDNSGGSA